MTEQSTMEIVAWGVAVAAIGNLLSVATLRAGRALLVAWYRWRVRKAGVMVLELADERRTLAAQRLVKDKVSCGTVGDLRRGLTDLKALAEHYRQNPQSPTRLPSP